MPGVRVLPDAACPASEARDDRHAGFARRPKETDRLKGRYRALGRPHTGYAHSSTRAPAYTRTEVIAASRSPRRLRRVRPRLAQRGGQRVGLGWPGYLCPLGLDPQASAVLVEQGDRGEGLVGRSPGSGPGCCSGSEDILGGCRGDSPSLAYQLPVWFSVFPSHPVVALTQA
jgi:hypothetical protein